MCATVRNTDARVTWRPLLGAQLKYRIFKYVRIEVISAVFPKFWLLVQEAALTGKYISNF